MPENKVLSIDFDKKTNAETVVVFLTKRSDANAFLLHSPERIVIDISDAFIPEVRINKQIQGNMITSVRAEQNQKDTVRVVLDIMADVPYQYTITPDETKENQKLSITVFPPATPKTTDVDNTSFDSQESVHFFEDPAVKDIFENTGTRKKASDLRLSGIVQIRASMDTKKEDRIENNTHVKNRILVESKYKNAARVSVLSDYLYFGSNNQTDDYNLDLHEAVFLYTNSIIDFSIGKQIIRWGKADQMSPVDTINPSDFREFILPDYDETKQPVWMANAKLLFDRFTIEGVFVPFFEKSELDYFGTDWAVFPHIKKEINTAPVSRALKKYFDDMGVHEQNPDTEAEFGLRLTTTLKNWDVGVSWHHATEDLPYFTSFPVKNITVDGSMTQDNLNLALTTAEFTDEAIEVEFKRTNVLGFEFETTLSDFGLRGEAAWYENESFLTSSLTSSQNATFTYVLGADYTTFSDIYINMQFAHRYISGYTSDILYFEKNNYSLLGEISRNIFFDWIEASMIYSVTLNDNSWYLSPRIIHTYMKNLELVVGANMFYGDDDTWLGRFDDNDQLFFDVSYRF
ncbi:MAG: AMIN domain-containing protein [Desulfotignum sp.]|nr:AMIN domain-containing protein [Desulfobacteraceae bacterium]